MNYVTWNGAGKRNIAALLASLMAAGFLTACGGGGGDTNDSQSNGPGISKETISINTAENKVEIRQLVGVIDPQSLTLVDGYDSPNISTAIADNTMTVTVGDLENAAQERFTVLTDSNIRYTVVVNASNTSSASITRQAKALTEISSVQLLVADDLRLLNTVLEIEYLAKEITESEKTGIRTLAGNTVDSSSTQLDNEILLLEQALLDYRDDAITETDLRQRLASTNVAMAAVGAAGADAVGRVADTLSAMGITLPMNLEVDSPLVYVPEANRYSRYMNSDYGSFDGSGSFRFAPAFDFFNAVFPYANQ